MSQQGSLAPSKGFTDGYGLRSKPDGDTDPKTSKQHSPGNSTGSAASSLTRVDESRLSKDDNTLVNEQSPLLRPVGSLERAKSKDVESGPSSRKVEYDIPTRTTLFLMLMTCCIGGLQIAWCVELSNGTPYLLSLGISKAAMALVWIAGPLSGTLVQPYVGLVSDRSRSRFGRRRPVIVVGCVATAVSLLLLAWATEIVNYVLAAFGADAGSTLVKSSVIVSAVLMVYVLDFAINTIQAGIRAFIVDNAPAWQQDTANAWASRMTGVGNIIGYLSSYVHLPRLLPFFGDTQFKVLCVIACIALTSTTTISCIAVKERNPQDDPQETPQAGGLVSFFKQVISSMRRLPPQIAAVCVVQFWAWIGWFPFLFYITTYVGEIYAEPTLRANPNLSSAESHQLWEEATQMGSLALLIFAIVAFAANIILPCVVDSRSSQATTSRALRWLLVPGFTIRRAWLYSHILFAACMWMTLFKRSVFMSIAITGVVGVCWALTLWAPYALLSAAISTREEKRRSKLRSLDHESTSDEPQDDKAGVILGIHNVAIAAPQVLATLGSSILFKMLQRDRNEAGDDSVGWVLRLAALASLVAAWKTMRVKDEE